MFLKTFIAITADNWLILIISASLLVTNLLFTCCESVDRSLLVVHLIMDMSFLYSYKPVLYPVAVSTFDQQRSEEQFENGDNTVQSLVDLCCQKIVQVHY